MGRNFIRFVVCMMWWVLSLIGYYLMYAFMWFYEKSMRMLETHNPDRAVAADSLGFEEGNILIHDYKKGSWVVLKYVPEQGYVLSDEEGNQCTVPKLEAELFYFRAPSHLQKRKHTE